MYTLPLTLTDDIRHYGSLIDEFTSGNIEPVKFKAIRVPMGIYEQRKDGTYMVRIRCVAGYINPTQLKQIAEIACTYHYDVIHITTRQELQIQNIDLKDTPLILNNLKEIGLSSKGGGGNTVRNIMASVNSGIAKDEVFDVTSYAVNMTSKLIAEPDSFILPRKFKISFSSSDKDNAYASFNDLGFIAKIKDGKRGFKVFLGGSLGSKPMIGFELFDFAPEEDLYYIADAAKKLFSRYGNRKNKHKARLRYVFYKLGKEKVFRLFFEIYDEIKKLDNLKYVHKEFVFNTPQLNIITETVNSEEFEKWKERFVIEQRQKDLYSVIIPFENGNVTYNTLIKIADFIVPFGDDVVRFSMRQNIHLRNIPSKYLGNVFTFLTKIGITTNAPLLLNNIVACTGADTCRLGICLSKGAGKAMRSVLSKSDLPLDDLKEITVNISGCPNSCGQQVASDLGFYGKVGRSNRMYPAYHIVAGAKIGINPKLAELVGEVSARDLPKFTIDLFRIYLSKKSTYKVFSDYIEQEGKQDIAILSAKYANIPDFADDKNYYFDWGSDTIFSLANKGIGECSAGLFDMIDVDFNTIATFKEMLEQTKDVGEINILLNKILFASSRMLLITRGAEPKSESEVFDAFIEKFINAKLINSIYKEIVEIAKNDNNYNFIDKQSTVLDLADAVVKLYENMDDSLQFKLDTIRLEQEQVFSPSSVTRKKDLRGVVCPLNFVKTKIELSTLKSGEILEIMLDDGEPIENVPGSITNEGHKILEQRKNEDYWIVTIQKA